MAGYRLYFLNARDSIVARQDFAASSDSDAKTISAVLWQACADSCAGYELWQLARRIVPDQGDAVSRPPAAVETLGLRLQENVLDLEEALLNSHWRVAQSERLLAATAALRGSLHGNGSADAIYEDVVRYVCAATGSKMMSLQLAEGMRLVLRGSRGFGRVFDEFFAIVPTGHCACGVAFENARQIVVPAIDASPIFAGQEALEVLRGEGVASCVSTPLLGSDGRIAGMFSIHRDRVWNPIEGELAQLRHMAVDIAAAIADPLSAAIGRLRAAV